MLCYNLSLFSVYENVLNCCLVCFDHEIEGKVMSKETTGNKGFATFFSRLLFFLFTVDTGKIHWFTDW